MAVFLTNICAFDSCGKKFASLPELIKHIEEEKQNKKVDARDENKPAKDTSTEIDPDVDVDNLEELDLKEEEVN